MKPVTTLLAVAAASLFTLGAADQAQAQSLTLTLQPSGALINVDDAAGRWQHEGGEVICPDGTTQIGHYAILCRQSFTGSVAADTLTIGKLGKPAVNPCN